MKFIFIFFLHLQCLFLRNKIFFISLFLTGTTRDVVQLSLDIGGYPVNVSDTAGLRADTTDIIEREGIIRACMAIKEAHFAVVVIDASEFLIRYHHIQQDCSLTILTDYFEKDLGVSQIQIDELKCEFTKSDWLSQRRYVILVNKIDLLEHSARRELEHIFNTHNQISLASLKTLEGVDQTVQKIKFICQDLCGSNSEIGSPMLTSERHRTHVQNCLEHINVILGLQADVYENTELSPSSVGNSGKIFDDFLSSEKNMNEINSPLKMSQSIDSSDNTISLLSKEDTLILAAQRLQLAANDIGCIIGHIYTEDVLDELFSTFCIGK